MSDLLKTAAGAAALFPGIGTGVSAALGIADALGAGDWLTKHVLGDSGATVAQAVVQAAAVATGGSVDQATVRGLPPDQQAALRVQIAGIAAKADSDARLAALDETRAYLADVASARSQTVSLASAGSMVQWAPVIVSVIVLSTFGLVMYFALIKTLPPGSETAVSMLLGTLTAMAASVVSYWVGSSSGSAQKTSLLYNSTPSNGGGQTKSPLAR